jgi:glycosyltransferase involved in cell wall biosynthesis
VGIWIKAYRLALKLNKENKFYGLLSLWFTECAVVGQLLGNKLKIPFFVWLQGQDAKKNNPYVKLVRPKPHQVIAISDFIQREFNKNHRVLPRHIIYNGITESAFPPLNMNERPIDIIGVGSLVDVKNYPLFLRVIKELTSSFPQLKAVIAGEGFLLAKLQEERRALKLEKVLEFRGGVSHSSVLEMMSRSKILLHTSKYEGNSTVMMEALYSGCQVISTVTLSDQELTRLHVCKDLKEIVRQADNVLRHPVDPRRILFNKMEASAQKMLSLYE